MSYPPPPAAPGLARPSGCCFPLGYFTITDYTVPAAYNEYGQSGSRVLGVDGAGYVNCLVGSNTSSTVYFLLNGGGYVNVKATMSGFSGGFHISPISTGHVTIQWRTSGPF